MLQPKRIRWRKVHTGTLNGNANRGSDVSFGDFALQATTRGWITARQIEAAPMAIQRKVKRQGKLYIRIFPDKPLTKKPLETRMGKGKGGLEAWGAVIRPGRVLYEIEGIPEDLAREAFRVAGHKLPLKTRFLTRESQL